MDGEEGGDGKVGEWGERERRGEMEMGRGVKGRAEGRSREMRREMVRGERREEKREGVSREEIRERREGAIERSGRKVRERG